MSMIISNKSLAKENRKYKRSDLIMKRTKLPTQCKTKRTICPRCSKRGYSKELKSCIKCRYVYTPQNKMTITKANEL